MTSTEWLFELLKMGELRILRVGAKQTKYNVTLIRPGKSCIRASKNTLRSTVEAVYMQAKEQS